MQTDFGVSHWGLVQREKKLNTFAAKVTKKQNKWTAMAKAVICGYRIMLRHICAFGIKDLQNGAKQTINKQP